MGQRRRAKNRIWLLAALLAWPAAPAGAAPDAAEVEPEAVGLSSEGLDRMRAALTGHVEGGALAGGVILIERRGRVAYFEAVGARDIERGLPMERDTIFRIYSMTKPIASAAALILVEEGRLRLDEPVSRHLPELKGLRVLREPRGELEDAIEAEREITLRDLLTHTSGLTSASPADTPLRRGYRELYRNRGEMTLADWLPELARLPLMFPPATQWEYGLSTDVLGRLVEVVSGQTFDIFLRERIFEPLGMVDTGFHVPAEKLDRLATLYSLDPGGENMPDPEDAAALGAPASAELTATDAAPDTDRARPPAFFSGGGGLLSTAADYLRFARMLLRGGELEGVRILSAETVARMTRAHLSERELEAPFLKQFFPGTSFGLGVSVVTDAAARGVGGADGAYGWSGAAGTHYWADPKNEMIGLFLVQIRPMGGALPPPEVEALAYSAMRD